MTKLLFRLGTASALLLSVISVRAQLSGTRIIGTAPSDYTTFTGAVNALQTEGISGSVTFEVKNGTYTEQLILTGISGLGPANTVTFKSQSGNPEDVVLSFTPTPTGSNDNYTLLFHNTGFISFNDMTIASGGSSHANVIVIDSAAGDLTFHGNVISGTETSQALTAQALVYSSTYDNFNIHFTENVFIDGSYGCYLYGTEAEESGLQIIGNRFEDQYYSAVYCSNNYDFKIMDNTITTKALNPNFRAVHLQYCDQAFEVGRNVIYMPITGSGQGIFVSMCDAYPASPSLIHNNFVSLYTDNSGTDAIGINCQSSTNQVIVFNSVNITGLDTYSKAIVFEGFMSDGLTIRNNIAVNQAGGYAFFTYLEPPEFNSDFNLLYSSGSRLAYYTGDIISLIDWRNATGQDLYSLNQLPVFVSDSNLHISGGLPGNSGIAISGITQDIDLQNRTSPDIGADEFDFSMGYIENQHAERIEAMPNPSQGSIYFSLPNCGETADIGIYSVSGQHIGDFINVKITNQQIILHLDHLEQGLYYLKIASGGQAYTTSIQLIH